MSRLNFKMPLAFALIGIALLSTSCNDDDDKTPTPPTVSITQNVSGEKGSNFTITQADGTSESATGDFILGWEGGQLLNMNYYRQLRIQTSKGSFTLRLNLPQGTNFQDAAIATHELSGYPLLLQNTGFLDDVVTEFVASSTSNAIKTSAFGTVTIMKDVVALGNTYSIFGVLDATFEEQYGTVAMKGTFWSNDGPW